MSRRSLTSGRLWIKKPPLQTALLPTSRKEREKWGTQQMKKIDIATIEAARRG